VIKAKRISKGKSKKEKGKSKKPDALTLMIVSLIKDRTKRSDDDRKLLASSLFPFAFCLFPLKGMSQ